MTCLICRTKFYRADWSSPAEDCDCGANLGADRLLELDGPEELRTLRREWQEQQADAAAKGATDAAQ